MISQGPNEQAKNTRPNQFALLPHDEPLSYFEVPIAEVPSIRTKGKEKRWTVQQKEQQEQQQLFLLFICSYNPKVNPDKMPTISIPKSEEPKIPKQSPIENGFCNFPFRYSIVRGSGRNREMVGNLTCELHEHMKFYFQHIRV